MNGCERCPRWLQEKETNSPAQKVIIPGVGEKVLCDRHNPWKTEGKEPDETLVWKEDPRLQGAK